jgi:drug/metabolite transporter (DMT)-like permease
MIGIGIFAWAGHELLTRAHGFAPASTLMPFGYSFIIYLTIWSMLIFGHVPDTWTILGAAIIIVSSMIIWARERHKIKHQAVVLDQS